MIRCENVWICLITVESFWIMCLYALNPFIFILQEDRAPIHIVQGLDNNKLIAGAILISGLSSTAGGGVGSRDYTIQWGRNLFGINCRLH